MSHTIYLGLDAHKDSVTIAVVPEGSETPAEVKKLPHDLPRLERYFRSLARDGATVRACYETSGVGFALQRSIVSWGYHCDVVASSLIPRTGGGRRRKFDKHDAAELARLYRKGELTPVRVPERGEEDDREQVRCRATVQRDLGRVRHYLLKLMTRHGLRYTGGGHWTLRHWHWLRAVRVDLPPGAQRTFDEYAALYDYLESRRLAAGCLRHGGSIWQSSFPRR